jgi:hypothetical protein
MQMLYDHYPELPYVASAPWPRIELESSPGQVDWIASMAQVETWLVVSVGHHWVQWTWNMSQNQRIDICTVRFLRDQDTTLFLLRFGG